MNKLSSQDRSALIRLASSLPAGSSERRVILAGLKAAGLQPLTLPQVALSDLAVSYSAEGRRSGPGGGWEQVYPANPVPGQKGSVFFWHDATETLIVLARGKVLHMPKVNGVIEPGLTYDNGVRSISNAWYSAIEVRSYQRAAQDGWLPLPVRP